MVISCYRCELLAVSVAGCILLDSLCATPGLRCFLCVYVGGSSVCTGSFVVVSLASALSVCADVTAEQF